MELLPPSSQPTKSNWNSPTSPQLMLPTIIRISSFYKKVLHKAHSFLWDSILKRGRSHAFYSSHRVFTTGHRLPLSGPATADLRPLGLDRLQRRRGRLGSVSNTPKTAAPLPVIRARPAP